MSSSDDNPIEYFDSLAVQLPPTTEDARAQVRKFSGKFVKIGENSSFDWGAFKEAVDQSSTLTFDKFDESTVNNDQNSVSVDLLAQHISEYLLKALKAVIDLDSLKTKILATITGIATINKETSFLNFSTEEEGSKTSWEYRIVFAIPGQNQGGAFYSLVTTIQLVATLVNESSWFGLKSSSTLNCSAKIKAMRLVVPPDFKA